jgi:hypothetical protein
MTKYDSPFVYVECVIANGVAIATAQISVTGEFISASGVSKRHPDDKFSPTVAENLAVGRALESLGKKLQKRADGIVKQSDDIARHKALVKLSASKFEPTAQNVTKKKKKEKTSK